MTNTRYAFNHCFILMFGNFISECTSDRAHCWLTHWGWKINICVSQLPMIGSDNGLLPGQHQAIIWTNDGILLMGPPRTNFNEILIKIHTFSFKKIYFKMSSGKWWPSCLGLNVLTHCGLVPDCSTTELDHHCLKVWCLVCTKPWPEQILAPCQFVHRKQTRDV